ncbi:hypothetical protein KFK09_010556 [Dendrobium nobile]|uniref:Coatomer subunit zeta n=2 Tax=Dendrobium TaxID=37818 RepID=A0A8T3BAB8_DENNO|nr:hypothetical protein KFK09_010556 [Dendrobium nobile]
MQSPQLSSLDYGPFNHHHLTNDHSNLYHMSTMVLPTAVTRLWSLDLHCPTKATCFAEQKRSVDQSRNPTMLLAVLFANTDGNILIERFHGVPAEERLHWRSFLVKLGAENLKGAKNEELFVASHKSVYIVYTMLGDICIYVVGKDDYDELALAEVIFAITSSTKDACGKPPTERLFLDKYGRICLSLDEIVWQGMLENTEKERIKRLIRMKPPADV